MKKITACAALAALAALAATGLVAASCAVATITGPPYNHHVGNTLDLRAAGLDKVSIGDIRKDPRASADVDKMRVQLLMVVSPYGSYTAYLREALSSEFDYADLLDPASTLRIDGVLLRNEIGGTSKRAFAELEMELTVMRGTETLYRATKIGRYEWEPPAAPGVAESRAISNYQIGVQRLIAAYIADPAFVTALRKR